MSPSLTLPLALALATAAVTAPASAQDATGAVQQVTAQDAVLASGEPVVEAGKPMRFAAVTAAVVTTAPTASIGPGGPPDPIEKVCLLESGSVDRASTPVSACTACHAHAGAGGHPVGMAYVTYGKDLRSAPMGFNSAVVLVANTLTCMTCHDARSSLPQHLAAPTGGDVEKRLCVACHPR
jgi:hypothetical protein